MPWIFGACHTLLHFRRDFLINVLQPGGWMLRLAEHRPSRNSAGSRPAPAGTAHPCSWDAHRRSRHLQTLCRSGRHGCASARGRQAYYLPPPSTDLQSLASPKPSASTNFPPTRKHWQLPSVGHVIQLLSTRGIVHHFKMLMNSSRVEHLNFHNLRCGWCDRSWRCHRYPASTGSPGTLQGSTHTGRPSNLVSRRLPRTLPPLG